MLLKDNADLSSRESNQIFFHSPAPDQSILHSPLPPNLLWLLSVPLVLAAHLLLTVTNENDRLPWEAAFIDGLSTEIKKAMYSFSATSYAIRIEASMFYLGREYKSPLSFLKQVFPLPAQPNLKTQWQYCVFVVFINNACCSNLESNRGK